MVDNDGTHGSQERSGDINLKAGTHAIRVEFFEASGGEVLEKGLFASSGGNKKAFTEQSIISQAIPEQQPVTLAVRTISGSGATVQAVMLLMEEW